MLPGRLGLIASGRRRHGLLSCAHRTRPIALLRLLARLSPGIHAGSSLSLSHCSPTLARPAPAIRCGRLLLVVLRTPGLLLLLLLTPGILCLRLWRCYLLLIPGLLATGALISPSTLLLRSRRTPSCGGLLW